jgi:hypothetical protein
MERLKQLKQKLESQITREIELAAMNLAWCAILVSLYLLITR